MKLSIITINLNNKSGLEKTLESVSAQRFRDFQYLVIDGGSDDGSRELLQSSDAPISRWISEPDTGIYNAMNKGIAMAKGEYLLFLNSGDTLCGPDTLEDATALLGESEVIYGMLRYERSGQLNDQSYPKELSFDYLKQHYLPHPASFIRRELFERCGLYEEKYTICADWVFFIKAICLLKASYRYIELPISVYNTLGISAQPEWQARIAQERKDALNENFSVFLTGEAQRLAQAKRLQDLQSSAWYKLGRTLGLIG